MSNNETDNSRLALRTLFIIFAVICSIIIIYWLRNEITKNQAIKDGKINAGAHYELVDLDYKTVEAQLRAAGFTDIELIDLNDFGLFFWDDGKVTNVSIGGDSSFDSNDWFYPDAKVVITIRDKGCGISDIKKAREPLFTTLGGDRAGLGFSVMESFTDKLTVRSKVGVGTTVTLCKRIHGRAR